MIYSFQPIRARSADCLITSTLCREERRKQIFFAKKNGMTKKTLNESHVLLCRDTMAKTQGCTVVLRQWWRWWWARGLHGILIGSAEFRTRVLDVVVSRIRRNVTSHWISISFGYWIDQALVTEKSKLHFRWRQYFFLFQGVCVDCSASLAFSKYRVFRFWSERSMNLTNHKILQLSKYFIVQLMHTNYKTLRLLK